MSMIFFVFSFFQICQRDKERKSNTCAKEALTLEAALIAAEAPVSPVKFFYVCMRDERLYDILLRLQMTHQRRDLLSGVLLAYCMEASGPCIEPKVAS